MTMVSNCHFYHQILACDCEVFSRAALGMLTLQRSEHQKSEGFDKQNLNRALTLQLQANTEF